MAKFIVMVVHHPGGPHCARGSRSCFLVSQSCRRIRRDESASPVAHAVARAIQYHAISPYQASCAKIHGGLFVLAVGPHAVAESSWLELGPLLRDLLAAAESSSEDVCVGAAILSRGAEQFHLVQRTSLARPVLCNVWHDAFAAYSVHLQVWLEDGTVRDGCNDFFISWDQDESCPLVPSGQLVHRYHCEYDRLPSFVSRASADRIFFAGNVVNCVKRYILEPGLGGAPFVSDSWKNPALDSDPPLCATLHRMATTGSGIGLALEAASILWRDRASVTMSRLIPAENIRVYFRSLRAYLLLGNELFWRAFFKRLRPVRHMLHSDMEEHQIEAGNRALAHIFESSLAETETNSGIPCILALTVRPDGQLAPSFDIPFPSSSVVAPSAKEYSDLFAVTFAVRRVALELDRCYGLIVGEIKKLKQQCRDVADSFNIRRRNFLLKCLFLRMRMGHFIHGFDNYLQADVFELSFRHLLRDLESAYTLCEGHEFDRLVSSHSRAVSLWISQSLASVVAVQRRLDEICESCLGLCELVGAFIERNEVGGHEARRIEAVFEQNVVLLLRVVSSLQGRCGSTQVSSLLLRLDWNHQSSISHSDGHSRPVFL